MKTSKAFQHKQVYMRNNRTVRAKKNKNSSRQLDIERKRNYTRKQTCVSAYSGAFFEKE